MDPKGQKAIGAPVLVAEVLTLVLQLHLVPPALDPITIAHGVGRSKAKWGG